MGSDKQYISQLTEIIPEAEFVLLTDFSRQTWNFKYSFGNCNLGWLCIIVVALKYNLNEVSLRRARCRGKPAACP